MIWLKTILLASHKKLCIIHANSEINCNYTLWTTNIKLHKNETWYRQKEEKGVIFVKIEFFNMTIPAFTTFISEITVDISVFAIVRICLTHREQKQWENLNELSLARVWKTWHIYWTSASIKIWEKFSYNCCQVCN